MAKLRVTLACWDYDRTRALQEGRVQVEGVELTYLPLRIEETFCIARGDPSCTFVIEKPVWN